MKRTLTLILTVLMLCTLLFGYGQKSGDGDPQDTNTEPALADGVYTADFSTDSSMFHVNEACKGKGTLTVENGQMTIHISLPSKSILNLFCGTAEDARKDGAALLQPTTDTVTYSDGLSEEVNGFDIPVPALDEEFDVAIIVDLWTLTKNEEDGTYTIAVTLEGGSGKASIQSPCTLTVADGKMTATIVWSSSHYDYMLVDGERCDVLSTENGSTFEIPVAALDTPLAVVGDTTAMSTPHEIDYTLTFDASSAEVNR